MKKTLIILIFSAFMTSIFGQADTTKSAPVRFTFGTGLLIENQTIAQPYKGGLELEVIHRFSLIENYHNLFGIYGAANTRLGLNYGITERLSVGIGTTKDSKLQDIQWKYAILRQNEDNSMPVSVSYYGNIVADLQREDAFGPEASYRHIHRLSYFNQFIIARKFSEKVSFQIAPSVAYFNSVPRYSDTTGYKNLNFGVSVGGRANLFGGHSVIVEYDQLLTPQELDENSKPNLAFGWEIGTATHTFQVFATNYTRIINQHNLVFNTNDFAKGEYLVGFNINVRF